MALNPSTAILITLWFWIATGVAGIIFAIYVTVRGEDTDEAIPIAAIMAIEAGSGGLLTLAATAAGWPGVSLFLWRGTAFIGVAIGLTILCMALVKRQRWRRERLAALGSNAPGSAVVSPTGIPTSALMSQPAMWTTIIGTVVMA